MSALSYLHKKAKEGNHLTDLEASILAAWKPDYYDASLIDHEQAAVELTDKEAVILAAQKVLEQFKKNGRMFDALMELEAALKAGVK